MEVGNKLQKQQGLSMVNSKQPLRLSKPNQMDLWNEMLKLSDPWIHSSSNNNHHDWNNSSNKDWNSEIHGRRDENRF
jgi:hypothetical protein